MKLLHETVGTILLPEYEVEDGEEHDFHINRMIRSFGDWTIGRLRDSLGVTKTLCCAKLHDEQQTPYANCEHFGQNLVCGHLRNSIDFMRRPLRSAGGLIATSAYVTDRLRTHEEPISPHYLERLNDFALKSYKLDGAAYSAFRFIQPNPPTSTSVPLAFRQPALEAIQTISELRLAIMEQEAALIPEITAIRDEVLGHFQKAVDTKGYSLKAISL